MKERPILFSAPMVRAILSGSKSQTRRVLKQATGPSLSVGMDDNTLGVAELSWLWGDGPGHDVHETIKRVPCPYGQPGERLLVRETFYAWGRWETRYSAKKGRDEWHFVNLTLESGKSYKHSADDDGPMFEGGKRNAGVLPGWWKRPAIFMPRAASRITLEITDVRVERLQDISEADAQSEGWTRRPEVSTDPQVHKEAARDWFMDLWESINGPGSWGANPWVWVVEFKKYRGCCI